MSKKEVGTMTRSTFEQAQAVVQSLPLEDKQRLRQWLAEEDLKLAGQNGADATPSALHREREVQWLAQHEAEYAGQWLALDGNRLLSHSEDPHKVRAEARAVFCDVVVIPKEPHPFIRAR
jgi:hypothetical protein